MTYLNIYGITCVIWFPLKSKFSKFLKSLKISGGKISILFCLSDMISSDERPWKVVSFITVNWLSCNFKLFNFLRGWSGVTLWKKFPLKSSSSKFRRAEKSFQVFKKFWDICKTRRVDFIPGDGDQMLGGRETRRFWDKSLKCFQKEIAYQFIQIFQLLQNLQVFQVPKYPWR